MKKKAEPQCFDNRKHNWVAQLSKDRKKTVDYYCPRCRRWNLDGVLR